MCPPYLNRTNTGYLEVRPGSEVHRTFPLLYDSERPNAGAHLLPEAGARHERTLEAVRCSAWLGVGSGTDIGLPPTTGQERHRTRTPTPIPPTAPALFDPHHHRIRADQVFHTGLPEPDVVQPSTAVGPRIVEATLRPEQHVQT